MRAGAVRAADHTGGVARVSTGGAEAEAEAEAEAAAAAEAARAYAASVFDGAAVDYDLHMRERLRYRGPELVGAEGA
eukprot:COSAG01_NODE_19542_length_1004_cov_1.338122_2_plen_76_part_01